MYSSGTYRVTRQINVPKTANRIIGDGVNNTVIDRHGESTDFLLNCRSDRTAFELSGLTLNANGKAEKAVLQFSGFFSHLSRVQDIAIRGPRIAGMQIDAGFTSSAFENVSISGERYGLLCDDTVQLSAVFFTRLRITNTQISAVYLRNPRASAVHSFSFYEPTIERNNGSAIDMRGGLHVRVFGGHLETNGKKEGKADILMGRFDDRPPDEGGTSALCSLRMFGTNFSVPSAAQKLTRIKFEAGGAQLHLDGVRMNRSYIVDGANKNQVSRVSAVSSVNKFQVANFDEAKVDFFP